MKKQVEEFKDQFESIVKEQKELSALTKFQIGAVVLTFLLFIVSIFFVLLYLKD